MAVGRGNGGTKVDLGGPSRHGKFPSPAALMLCARASLNYQHNIKVLCRAARLAAYPAPVLEAAAALADAAAAPGQRRGPEPRPHLAIDNFAHRNTDGPLNPYSRVYTVQKMIRESPILQLTSASQHYRHAPPPPVRKLPGESWLGWPLWVHLQARWSATALHVDAGSEQR
jgi:hypothetical protein